MNKIILMGYVASDVPESPQDTPNGKRFVKFSLAVNRMRVGVDFFNLIAWEKLADTVSRYVKKGSQIMVEGHMQIETYTDRNGEKRKSHDVVVEKLEFCGKKDDHLEPKEEPKNEFTDIDDPGLPFN